MGFGVYVAPFTGAWIETKTGSLTASAKQVVAPFTGAWIETCLPFTRRQQNLVAPFTGAWIETCAVMAPKLDFGRTLHGCVD